MGDLMIHISEELTSDSLVDLESRMNHIDGVVDCHMAPRGRHMLAVSYDGAKVSSSTLLHQITDQHIQAQLVGF